MKWSPVFLSPHGGLPQEKRQMPDSELFIEKYVETGDILCSLEEGGYKLNKTTGYNLRRKFQDEIQKRVHERLRGGGPKALSVVEHLMVSADSETVRLGAAKDMLDRGGFKVYEEERMGRTVEEMEQQLVALVGKDGAKLLVSSVRTRKSISGPELTEA